MKKALFLIAVIFTTTFSIGQTKTTAENKTIATLLDNWHQAAADAKFDDYFAVLSTDSRYIGTDQTENWNLDQFKAFAKPYFDSGKAWNFKSIQRNIFLSNDGNLAWFDELLDTQMKICRGSGVLRKEKNGKWKIVHYVLSMTIPNEKIDDAIKAKSAFDDSFIKELKTSK